MSSARNVIVSAELPDIKGKRGSKDQDRHIEDSLEVDTLVGRVYCTPA
jgi:hypothetical protein